MGAKVHANLVVMIPAEDMVMLAVVSEDIALIDQLVTEVIMEFQGPSLMAMNSDLWSQIVQMDILLPIRILTRKR